MSSPENNQSEETLAPLPQHIVERNTRDIAYVKSLPKIKI